MCTYLTDKDDLDKAKPTQYIALIVVACITFVSTIFIVVIVQKFNNKQQDNDKTKFEKTFVQHESADNMLL